MKKNISVSYEKELLNRLADPSYAAEYLNALLEQKDFDMGSFLLGLRDVAKANGIGLISETTGLGRESLYKTLSANGNPRLLTLSLLFESLGLEMKLSAKPKKRKPKSRLKTYF